MSNHTRFNIIQVPSRGYRVRHPSPQPRSRRARTVWTLGNLLMLAGCYLLLFVGGIYAQAEYNRQAARGDNDLPVISEPAVRRPAGVASEFTVPVLAEPGQVVSNVPVVAQSAPTASVSRIVIPSIGVDAKVVEVGWHVVQEGDQPVAVWEVAEYAVGQHRGSANPGDGGNVVLAGHVGGYGKVFADLYHIQPGEPIIVYSDEQQFLYVVQERLVLDEEGMPPEQRAANARYIEPMESEVVTLVTCWPPGGPARFTQRIIVRAVPYGSHLPASPPQPVSPWTVR